VCSWGRARLAEEEEEEEEAEEEEESSFLRVLNGSVSTVRTHLYVS
jgi:hypothetical protein